MATLRETYQKKDKSIFSSSEHDLQMVGFQNHMSTILYNMYMYIYIDTHNIYIYTYVRP
jgi:hypothetical protein